MEWKIQQTIPTLATPQLDAGIEFYGRLGFELEWKWPESEPTHAGLCLGECSIMLALCEPEVSGDVYFIVDDVDACHGSQMSARAWELAQAAGELAEGRGFPPAQALLPPAAPQERGYGLRDFQVIDPWGNSLSFGESVT